MNTRLARTVARTAAATAAALATAGAVLVPAGVASAAPAPAPTACAPENVHSTVRPADSSAGHRHYTVVMTADPGTAPCALNGWPHLVGASLGGAPRAFPHAGTYGRHAAPVPFGPGSPAQFDIRVANSAGPAWADTVEFTASGTYEQIPGRFVATGRFGVDADIAVGPVRPVR